MKKSPHFRGGTVHALRMPLNAYGEGMSGKFDAFDGAVLCPGADQHVFSRSIYRLMVKTVYIEDGTDVLPEPAVTFCPDPVADIAADADCCM